MKKINKLLAFVMALAMVLALAGCGSEGKDLRCGRLRFCRLCLRFCR